MSETTQKKNSEWYLFECKCGKIYATDYPFMGCGSCGTFTAGSKEDHEKGLTMKYLDEGNSEKIAEWEKQYPALEICSINGYLYDTDEEDYWS